VDTNQSDVEKQGTENERAMNSDFVPSTSTIKMTPLLEVSLAVNK